MLHLARPLAHRIRQQQLSARLNFDRRDLRIERALIRNGKVAQLLKLIAEEVGAHRMVVRRREHIEDAAAHRELAAAGDHVHARVGEGDELPGKFVQVVAATALGERDRFEHGEPRREGLECGAHARDHDDRMLVLRLVDLPLVQAPQRPHSLAHGFRARAQALVRERLPGRELEDLGIRNRRRERIPQRL